MKRIIVAVSYFDSLRGGAGLTRMALTEVEAWLKINPGFLIRELTTVQIIEE